MMGFDARAARAAWSVFLVVLLLAVVYLIRKILLVFFLAILFAYLLSPLVNLADRFLSRGRSRTYSLAVVYALMVVILIAAGMLIGGKVTDEAADLAASYPTIIAGMKQKLADPQPAWLYPIKQYISQQINARGHSVGAAALPLIQQASQHAVTVLSSAMFVVLIPILSFFFLKDGRELTERALSLAGDRRGVWDDIFADLHLLLGQFIRALVILSGATLVAYTLFFSIIGLPYGALLATLAALLEFIPVIGPLAGAVLVVLVAAFSGAGQIVVILVFLAVYRLFQDYVLNPHLMGAGIELHPLLVIFGALAGEQLAGVPGMFLSVPVMAMLRVGYARIRKKRVALGAVPEADSPPGR